MAASTITQIATWMNAAIKATTPDVRSGIPYRKASGSAPLQEQEPNGRDSQRQFQIQMAPITGLGDFVGPCYELEHEMTVVMRYVMDGRNRDDWDDLQLMAADDAKRIVLALTRPPLSAPWSDGGIFNILPVDHSPIERNERWEGVWEQSITFGLLYADEANTRDFECMTVYADSTALTATDGTTTWLGTTRAEVRRLTDGTLYYWTGTEWSQFYLAGDVPAFADLTAIEAATLAGDQVAYSTADSRLARVESSVARLLFDDGDVNTYASTAAMEAATLYGEQLGAIGGSVYQIQGGTATMLEAASPAIGNGYTSLVTLHASTGTYSGEPAVWWSAADGIPLARFRWSTRRSAWLLTEAKWDGLTTADQAAWDALASGDSYSWTTYGVQQALGGALTFFKGGLCSGLTINDCSGASIAFGARIRKNVGSHPSAGSAYPAMGLVWDAANNDMIGATMPLLTTQTRGAAFRRISSVRSYSFGNNVADTATRQGTASAAWSVGGTSITGFTGSVYLDSGSSASGIWADQLPATISNGAESILGVGVSWDPGTGPTVAPIFSGVVIGWGIE